MANNYQEGIDKAKKEIDELQGKLITMQNSILENAKQFNSMLSKGAGSMKETQLIVSKVTQEFEKLNETKKESIVVDGKIKVKQSELASTMQSLNEQRKREEEQIKKANKARVQEADRIERNKQALQKQKTASIELSRAYVQLINQQKQAKKTLQDLIVSQGKNSAQTKKAQKEYDILTKKVNQANKATSNFSKTGLGSMARGFKNLIGAFGVIGGVQLFADLTKKGFDLARQLDSLNFTMKSVIENEVVLSRTQIFLSNTAEKYGASILKLTERYNKFYTAAKQSGVSLEDTEAIFKSFTKSAGFLGLRSHELEGVFLALEQMLSKGKVTTEELRRQLGERLPGAFGVMADTVNKLNPDIEVTVSVLDEMLKKGEILSAEVLPEFAKQYEKSIGITQKERVETLNASIERMTNSWVKFIGDVTKSEGTISKVLIMAIDLVTDFVDTLNLMNQTQEAFNKTLENKSFLNQIKYYKELGKEASSYANIDVKNTKKSIKNKKEELELNKRIIKSFKDRDWAEHERLAKENNISLSDAKDNVVEYERQLSTLNGRLRAAELASKGINKVTDKGTEKRRTLSVVLKEITSLQDKLNSSTKEEAREILNKISILNKEKKAWEDLYSVKGGKRDEVKPLDLPEIAGVDEKSFEFLGKTKEEIESILKIEEFRLEMLKGSGDAYLKQNDYIESIKSLLKDIPDNKLLISPKNNEEIDKLLAKLTKIDIAQNAFKEVTDTFSDMFDIDTSKFDFIFDSLKDKSDDLFSGDNISAWADLSKELIGSVLDASMQRYETELNEAARVRDLTLNNDLASEEAKDNARKKYDKEERRIKTEQAKAERENTLIKIAMDTAAAVISIWAQVPKFDFGISAGALTAATVALGAVQAGIVASQPLPKFETGTDNSPEGWAITQERRPEPIVSKDGRLKTMGTLGGDSLTYLEKGDRVFKSREDFYKEFNMDSINSAVFDMNMSSMGSALSEDFVDTSLLREISGLKESNEKVWKEVKKLASRPLNINNKIELKDDRAY